MNSENMPTKIDIDQPAINQKVDIKKKTSEKLRDSLKRIKDSQELKKIHDDINKYTEKEELILFISFDLVNSSSYKTRNYSKWFPVIIKITEYLKKSIKEDIKNAQLWRTIGDEAVFIVKIKNIEQLQDNIQSVFKILNKSIEEIKNGNILGEKVTNEEKNIFIAQNTLSLKSTAWLAPVKKTKYTSEDISGNDHNLMYLYNHTGEDGFPIFEFQGNDIDTGFRLTKQTRERRLTLSVELAYLLTKNQLIDSKINIVSYKSLKGIWNGKIYPIIWYHDDKIAGYKLEDSFFYDEYYKDDITKEYIDKEYRKINFTENSTSFQKLRKIITDINILWKINDIELLLDSAEDDKSDDMIIKGNKMLEVHCVAIVFNKEKNKVLMFKRSGDTCDFGGKWDFGCCEVRNGQSFKENLEKDYQKKYGINIEVLDPIKEYYFENSEKKVIPGIRFIAKLKDETNIKINDIEYEDYKFINIDEFITLKDISTNEYIDYEEFKKAVEASKRYMDNFVERK